MNEQDKAKFLSMAAKAKSYIESIHEEAKDKFYCMGDDLTDEWLEFTIIETEELLHELDTMIEKYNGQGVAHTDLFYGGEVETIYHKYLRVIK